MAVSSDKDILDKFQGEGKVLFLRRSYCIYKKSSLLLALPRDRNLALMTLALYQPQAWKAVCLAHCLRLLTKIGAHRWVVPCRELTFRDGGPLSELKPMDGAFGFMLGNPESNARRVIMIRRTDDGITVDKVGFSREARETVTAEASVIRSLPVGIKGVLELKNHHSNDNWSYYSASMVEGRSPRKQDDDRVLSVLSQWMGYSETLPLHESSHWQRVMGFVQSHGMERLVETLVSKEDLHVKIGVYHGDLAPWNVKITSRGRVTVMDWEYGGIKGPAAWDWIHYLLQRASLVDHLSDAAALQVCRDWARTPKGKQFMIEAGWGDNVELCIGTYLIYSSSLGKFVHDSLLSEWIGK